MVMDAQHEVLLKTDQRDGNNYFYPGEGLKLSISGNKFFRINGVKTNNQLADNIASLYMKARTSKQEEHSCIRRCRCRAS